MASLQTFLAALLIVAVAFDPRSVNAKFSKSMSFYWGANNSAILGEGDDLQLVLNRKSGDDLFSMFISQIFLTLASLGNH